MKYTFSIANKMNKNLKLEFLFIFLITNFIFANATEKQYPLVPFEYGQVKLNDGEFLTQLNKDKEYYLNISNDDILKGFRLRSGSPSPGIGLGGWYGQDVFHVFGQLLSGYARLYASTGDIRCLTKANYLIDEWSKTIRSDGYFYYSNKPNDPAYIYEKMVGGLVDCNIYCHNQKALDCLSIITDWAITRLDTTRVFGQNIDIHNGEWYTLSENLYRAYLVTGDIKYYTFAEFWEYTEFWDIIRANGNPFLKQAVLHAYSHLNTLSSAAAAYRAKGDLKYLETCIAGYHFFRDKQCFVTGGFGANESLVNPSEITNLLKNTNNSFEVGCGSWACFKLCKSLISFTGNATYGDWIELLMINGIGADIPMSADGQTYYYANYNPSGAIKVNISFGWSCCTGTRPQAVADFQDLIYFHNDNDLFVNLFVPSTLKWKGLDITQKTTFPNEGKTVIEFSGSNSTSFTMGFRKAEWFSKIPEVKVNGQVVVVSESNGWYTYNKAWTNGDVLEIELPMEFKVSKLPDGKSYPAAIKYGPVTMAVQLADEYPIDALTAVKTPIPNEPLNFKIEGHPNWVLRPYYRIVANDPYIVYLDSTSGMNIPESSITRVGTWYQGTNLWSSNQVGAYVEVLFKGVGIRWKGYKFNDAGIANLTIDDNFVGAVDQYNISRDVPFQWEKNDIAYGIHTLRITISGSKNQSSIGNFINYSDFTVFTSNSDKEYATIASSSVKEGNNWSDGAQIRVSSQTGATISANFYGTGIRWNGKRYANGGIISASIDGTDKGSFDISKLAAIDDVTVSYDFTGLSLGNHKLILIQTTPNTYINYSHFSNLSTTVTHNGTGWYTIWSTMNSPVFNYCLDPESSATINFNGTGIRCGGELWTDSGITTFAIDSGNPVDVDLYGMIGIPMIWEKNGLINGPHSLICTLSGRHNNASTGYAFNYQFFEPIGNEFSGIYKNTISNIILNNDKLICANELNGKQVKLLVYDSLGQSIINIITVFLNNEIELPKINGFKLIVLMDLNNQCIFSSKRIS
jgi:DUF1680 family protein